MRDEFVKIIRDRADVLGNAPLVIVENADKFFGGVANVIERLEGDTVGQGGVAEDADDIFVRAFFVARRGHAERGGKRGARVAGAVAIVRAFGAQREAVQAVRGANGVKAIFAPGEQLVNVDLVADVPDEFILGSLEHAMQREGQFDDAEIRPEMPAVFGEDRDQLISNFLAELAELIERQLFDVFRLIHFFQDTTHIILLIIRTGRVLV